MLKELNPGDIIATAQNDNPNASYYNYYFGDLNENTALIALNRNEGNNKVVKALEISKSSIIKIIHNVSDKVHLIKQFNEINKEVYETFNLNVFNNHNSKDLTKSDNILGNSEINKENTRYSLYNIESDTKTSHKLRLGIVSGDYVEINGLISIVLDNNNGQLKLYNHNGLTKNSSQNVNKIVKINPEFDIYSGKNFTNEYTFSRY